MKYFSLFRNRRFGAPDIGTSVGLPTERAKACLHVGVVVGIILAADLLEMSGAECGSSGNTYWTQTQAGATAGAVADATNVFWTSGTIVSSTQKGTGAGYFSRDFVVTLSRPLVVDQSNGVTRAVVVAGNDGYIYSLDPKDLSTLWSRNLRRQTCAADSLQAAPVVQLRHLSDTNFQAVMANDVVIVGTAYGCSTTTANRVYGINAITGGIIWNHNGTGTYQYDRFTGLAVDYGRNTVYATTLKTDANHTQNTVIALNTLTGARRWGWDYGGIEAEPVLANGGLFVATRAGILYKLDPDTGATIWQTTIVTSPGLIIQNVVVDAAFNTIYVVDTVGVIHALLDTCTGVVGLWSSSLSGAMVSAPPALFTNPDVPKLYVGSYNGRVYQLNHNTGVTESYATIYGSSTSVDVVAVTRSPGAVIGGYRLIAEAGGTMKYICIPWAADGAQKAIVTVPACYDPNAPTSGLEVGGDLGRKISPTGQGTTRLLSVSKSTCYAFQCASLFGNLPSGLGVSALTSTNATPVWDSSSFVAEATMGLPMTVSLTVTSSIPGTYLTTLILGNAGNVHATVTLTNIVVAPITLSIALNGSQAELTWATNAAGFQLEYTPSLTPPITWQNIASGITTVGTLNHYSVADTATTSNRFYRLRFP